MARLEGAVEVPEVAQLGAVGAAICRASSAVSEKSTFPVSSVASMMTKRSVGVAS
ncbi:MAG TPA: hypothetical protein VFT09_02620 [Ilumatobacteraceae bacterium]|nr:hypothetical protein [Ilumatobacteraceae bacterium]